MSEEREFDVIVLGAGPVGENVAERTVKGGLRTAIVESELVGGECSYWACMPSKALLRPGEALAEARALAGARQAVTGSLDLAAVLQRRNSFTHNWDDKSQVDWLDSAGIALFRGHGRLTGPKAVEVEIGGEVPGRGAGGAGRAGGAGEAGDGAGGGSGGGAGRTVTLTARHAVVIATGSAAALPPVDGLAEVEPWTSRDATSAQAAPESLLVLGGGVVGCEMAQAWSSLGSKVTIVERSGHLLMGVEPFAGELLAEAMRERGIEVRLDAAVESVRRDPSTKGVTITLGDGTSLHAEEVLVAAGRTPRTGDIGLETVGLEPGSWLAVDDTLLVENLEGTDGNWLYATGDVNHRALLTHQGKYQGRICGDVIAARARGERVPPTPWSANTATADHASVPAVVFTDPQVASVGLTEARAREAGIDIKVVEYEIGNVAGASIYADGYKGKAQMVVDESRRVVVGATFVGPGVAELLQSATIAIVGEVPLERLWHAVPSYPTISEIWLRLLETYGL